MASIVLLCTDGSDVSIDALRSALPLLAPADRTIVVTVESSVDADTTTGTGFTSQESAPDLANQIETSGDRRAKQILDATVAALGLDDVELMAIVGRPGYAICELAKSLSASVVVVGTSGRSGLRRAMMGSTSDHIIRHAPCPVLVQGVGQH
jgi:nucleotide-binding universal stress UspA family protein